jgi:hypothetical protein
VSINDERVDTWHDMKNTPLELIEPQDHLICVLQHLVEYCLYHHLYECDSLMIMTDSINQTMIV